MYLPSNGYSWDTYSFKVRVRSRASRSFSWSGPSGDAYPWMLMRVMLTLLSFFTVLIVSMILFSSITLLLNSLWIAVTLTGKSMNAEPFSVLIFDVSTCGVRKASYGTNVGRGCKRAMQMKSSASGMPQPQLFSISERVAWFIHCSNGTDCK